MHIVPGYENGTSQAIQRKKMGSDDILNEKDLSYNKWKTNQISFPIELIHGNTLGLSFIFSGQRMFLPVP